MATSSPAIMTSPVSKAGWSGAEQHLDTVPADATILRVHQCAQHGMNSARALLPGFRQSELRRIESQHLANADCGQTLVRIKATVCSRDRAACFDE